MTIVIAIINILALAAWCWVCTRTQTDIYKTLGKMYEIQAALIKNMDELTDKQNAMVEAATEDLLKRAKEIIEEEVTKAKESEAEQ